MKQGLMRRRIARCVALFYVLFVVLSDMAGTGASFGAIRTKAAEYAQVGNYAQLTGDADGVSYPARVAVTAKATGEGTLQYRFRVGTANEDSSLIQDYSTSNTATWNANYAGTKVLYVDVKDDNEAVATKTIDYIVTE